MTTVFVVREEDRVWTREGNLDEDVVVELVEQKILGTVVVVLDEISDLELRL